MRWCDELTLIALEEPAERVDAHGFPSKKAEVKTVVFADKKSVGYSEFYKAQQAGYTAEMKLDVYAEEYAGQTLCEYEGKRYRVLRTYDSKNGEIVELTLSDLSERAGADDGKN